VCWFFFSLKNKKNTFPVSLLLFTPRPTNTTARHARAVESESRRSASNRKDKITKRTTKKQQEQQQ
jgi:hypothetical protein